MTKRFKLTLDERELPKEWYNINADMPFRPAPVLHPATKKPIKLDSPGPLPMALSSQEACTERWIEIPEPIRDIYKLWRPTPMFRAHRLERMLDTPAHIYYKYEGLSPVGSHKANTAVAQAFYNKEAGAKVLTTETGAGQWGSALAMACHFFNMTAQVYMVKLSYHQKPYRRILMQSYGADVYASPTDRTAYGRSVLKSHPDCQGSLGIAVSEAIEAACLSGGTARLAVGGAHNFVMIHQSVIGLEALKQMEMADEYPDTIIACAGSGSNLGGFSYPFLHQSFTKGRRTRVIAVEPTACPTMTKGRYTFDYSDTAAMGPIMKMYTLGHSFVPPGIHAGGLRYHGMAPSVSALVAHGYIEARAAHQLPVFNAAIQFAGAEGIIPAPESAHAIRVAIDEALRCKETGEAKVIAFCLSGNGHFDMGAYQAYHEGVLKDYTYPKEAIEKALTELPKIPESNGESVSSLKPNVHFPFSP
jgi:tryptophan synthase beta chain